MSTSVIAKIYAIDRCNVMITRTEPALLAIHACGRAPTTGWSEGQLSKHMLVAIPEDGIQGFDFNARTPDPSSPRRNILTPISAHLEFANVDLDNYWGTGRPLKGVRVHALANEKTIHVVDQPEAARLRAQMSPCATVAYVGQSDAGEAPSFEEDIKPLFRPDDVSIMTVFAGFNLHKYDDVKTNADKILDRLTTQDDNRRMPCDGRWPDLDIAKFRLWMKTGMLA